jgi:hypothetical protein
LFPGQVQIWPFSFQAVTSQNDKTDARSNDGRR